MLLLLLFSTHAWGFLTYLLFSLLLLMLYFLLDSCCSIFVCGCCLKIDLFISFVVNATFFSYFVATLCWALFDASP